MYLKKELYAKIQSDESIFDFIQESALDGLWYWDLENPENEWMNAKFWTVLGYSPDEMPHKSSSWQGIINQDDLKLANDNFIRHCENPDHPYDQVVRYTHKDGSTVWIHCRGMAIRDNSGKPIRMLGAHQDISDIKNREQELIKANQKVHESEAKLNALFTSMSEMVVLHELVCDENGKPVNYRITDCNDAFTRITGIARKNAIGRLSTEVYGTEHPPYLNEFSQVALSGESYYYKTYFQPMDKHFSVSVISPEKNQFATVTTDITKHKQAEETLRESEQNLSITLHSIGDGVITTDNFGMIDRMNPVALKLCGWHEDEIKGKPLTEVFNIIDAYTREPVPNPVEKVMENGGIVGLANHTVLVAKDGSEYQIADSAAPIKDKDGNIRGVVLVFSDVSEKYAAEQQIIKAKEKAEESEARYRTLFENMNTGFVLFEVVENEQGIPIDLIILAANEGFEKTIGLNLKDAVGMHLTKVLPGIEKDEADWIGTYSKVAHTREYTHFEQVSELLGYYYSISAFYAGPKQCAVTFQDITARKLAEEKIREKDIQFQKLSSNLPDLIYQFTRRPDGSYCVPIASEGIKNIFGCSPEDVLEDFTPIGRVIHPEDAERVINDIEYSAKHLSYFTCEFRVHIPGKPVQWILSRSTPEKLPDGSVTWYGFNANITERKQTEEELYKSNQRLESLLEISQKVISTIEQDEIMQMIVDNATRLIGLDTGATYLKNNNETISLSATTPELPSNFPDDLRKVYLKNHPHLNKALQTGKRVLMEDALSAKLTSEEKKIVDSRGLRTNLYQPIILREKTIGVLILSSVDTPRIFTHNDLEILQAFAYQAAHIIDNVNNYTRTKQSEIQLRKLSQAVKQSPAIVVITNLNGDIEYVNPMFSEVTGYTFEEAIGQNPRILKSGELPAEVYKELWETITAGEIWKGELHNKKKNGDLFWEAASISSITNSEGQITHFLAVKEDVTKKKLTEQELIVAKVKAEESDRLKSAFLANMSHEIRTPMNGILGFSDLLKKPGLKDEEQQAYIEMIEKSGARMLNIINDIIDVSKIEAGLIELDMKESNINEQIEYVYTFFKPEAEIKGIKLSFSNTLPQKEATIKTDREKLYAILTNLVKNALKYTEKGSIQLGYNLITDHERKELEFYVKDTGIGIPKDRQEAIFERFIQADIEDKMARQGAGLGLSITKAYVETFGGTMWVESEVGKGSTFYFTLPYNTEPAAETIDRQPERSDRNDGIRKIKTLIVEDDEVSEMLIENYINSFSRDILKAKTGGDAIETCRKNPDIDLILMDIRMPGMGGYEATKQIREFNKDVIIIAQTAYGLSGDREKAIEAKCNDYISKPINKNEIQAMIQKYFGQ